jgi:hypothetical protein
MSEPLTRFRFDTEFDAQGEVLRGPDRKYFSREETDQMAAKARAEGEVKARQTVEAKGFASVDKIVAHLAPVAAQLAGIAEQLRAEAAEMAIIAARKIAGSALDKAGDEACCKRHQRDRLASSSSTRSLRSASLRNRSPKSSAGWNSSADRAWAPISPSCRTPRRSRATGLWCGAKAPPASAARAVEATIEAIINARLQDPVAPQLELFSA